MNTPATVMNQVLEQYFHAWEHQDSDALVDLFTKDGIYKVKPFGLEEYHGIEQIRHYWETNPVAMQLNPNPKLLNVAFGTNICFAEWENTFTTREGVNKTTRGMLLLEFNRGQIQELREHYLSTENT